MSRPPFKPASMLLPIALLLVAMVCFQLGAALAKQLFPAVGAAGTVALRLGLAAVMMSAVWRPWRMRPTSSEVRIILGYGLAMGWMNFFFYASLERIPLGIAVALEFAGPLALAMLASRRPVDFLWIVLAVLGLIAFLPLRHAAQPLDAIGIVLALAAAVCWALYIVFGQRAGNTPRRPDCRVGHHDRGGLHGADRCGPCRCGTVLAGAAADGLRRRAALECAAVFDGNVRHDARADAHVRCADEPRSGARGAVRHRLPERVLERDPMVCHRQHHGRVGGQRRHEPPHAAAGANRSE